MSTKPQAQPDSNLKREDLDESDEDMEVDKRPKHKDHHGKKHKKASRGKEGDNEQMSGSNDDEDLDDENLDEEEDDYDEEDGNESFIAPDEEVERELMEEKMRKEEELRKKHKRRHKKKIKKLDEDDLDLIKDNTGINIPRRRLKRNVVEEKEDGSEKENERVVKKEQAYSDEEEQKKSKRPHQHARPQREAPMMEEDRDDMSEGEERGYQMTNSIFMDPSAIRQNIRALHRRQGDVSTIKTEGLESIFDEEEIDYQHATKQDKQIAELDIPERLQLKIGDRLGPSEEELVEESEWIFDRLQQNKKRDLVQNGALIKKKIEAVLHQIRNTGLDVPMVAKYRRYIYAKELEEQDVYEIFKLDQEFGQFKVQKNQIRQFLKKIQAFNPEFKCYEEELHFAKNQNDLNGFSALVQFLKNYYHDELQTLPEEQKRKAPARADKTQTARRQRLDEFVRKSMLRPDLFTENLQHNNVVYKPPEPENMMPFHLTQQYQNEVLNEEMKVLNGACDFAAAELAAQPYIRSIFKQHYYDYGIITTAPTEKGNKDLDVFHPSYRVKRIDKEQISSLHPNYRANRGKENYQDDLFLDILHNEKQGLITVTITLEKPALDSFQAKLVPFYMPIDESPQWNILRKEVLRRLVEVVLVPHMTEEIRTELREVSEDYVIKCCQQRYKEMLMTGPFDCQEGGRRQDPRQSKPRGGRFDEEIIKDRPRYNVMGVIMQQLDNNNCLVTVAVVDRFGELIAHKDLMHLQPPKKLPAFKDATTEEEVQRQKKIKLTQQEETKEHEIDKDRIKEMISKYQVDLIVVGANKLEARRIKDVLKEVADNMKMYGGGDSDDDKDPRKSKKKDYQEESKKEAFVIWGGLEVSKLFASSHQSEKLLKNCSLVVKQAVSLARFEQDPMCEMLNLWSSIPSENSMLSLGLHSLQKQTNESKLAEALEEVSVYSVNEVGLDLNIVVEHDHMQNQLQFISGLGPRKAKKLIQKLKQVGKKVFARSEFVNYATVGKNVFVSAIGFLKIKVPVEELEKNQGYDLLDQTRIHLESYTMAIKVACDVISQNIDSLTDFQKYTAIKEVIQNPSRIRALDIKQYEEELRLNGQASMTPILDIIIEEFQHPFKDPREYRTPSKISLSNKELFYLLTDESERTFKTGVIVNATIVKVDKNVICKLDNGLDAIIHKEEICAPHENLSDILQPGQVITGRIDKIQLDDEKKFGVTLKCKRGDLERHDKFVDQSMRIHEEDMVNPNFKIEQREKQVSRYQPRRITHPKFKNVSSQKALEELATKDNGEFLFRPSSQGTDNLTLTWKFYNTCFVHINIAESDKAIGASIGNKLHISDEIFDNLQEIIERYIIPCNRLLKEVTNHAKFLNVSNEDELGVSLRQEKTEDPNRIPYRFCLLEQFPQYVVIGYIAKADKIEKEYIKIKPRGYYFHDRYHNPFTHLINWYKENFRSRDYQKLKMRYDKKPPIVRQQQYPDPSRMARSSDPTPHKREDAMSWEPAQRNSYDAPYGETPMAVKSEYASRPSEIGGQSRYTGGATNAQFSEYNSGNNMQGDNSQRPPRGVCFNCQQEGHMSKDCTQKRTSTYGRGRGRGGDRDRDDNPRQERSDFGGSRDYQPRQVQSEVQQRPTETFEQPTWGNNTSVQDAPSKSPGGNAWGDTAMKAERSPTKPKSPAYEGGWGQQEQPASSGWGQKTPNRSDVPQANSWGDDGGNNDNWGGNAGGDGGSSPTRSQGTYGDRGGRGRGRGRGDRPPGDRPQGGGGGRECYKCHQEGHMARECPNVQEDRGRGAGRGRGGPGGGGRECFKCGQEGHMARECPNQDSSNDRGRGRGRGRGRDDASGGAAGGSRSCYKCGQEGHYARECPNPSEGPGERGYKRQRRDDDGGSYRRYDDNNNAGGDRNRDYNNTSSNNNDRDAGAGGWEASKDSTDQPWGPSGGWNANQAQADSGPAQQQEPNAWGVPSVPTKSEEPEGWNNNNNNATSNSGGGGWQ